MGNNGGLDFKEDIVEGNGGVRRFLWLVFHYFRSESLYFICSRFDCIILGLYGL